MPAYMYHCFYSSVLSVYFNAVIVVRKKTTNKTTKKPQKSTMLFSAQSLLLQGYVVVPQGD